MSLSPNNINQTCIYSRKKLPVDKLQEGEIKHSQRLLGNELAARLVFTCVAHTGKRLDKQTT